MFNRKSKKKQRDKRHLKIWYSPKIKKPIQMKKQYKKQSDRWGIQKTKMDNWRLNEFYKCYYMDSNNIYATCTFF